YLPTTHVLNSITYAFSGKDIMGNRMRLGGATLGAASIIPLGKVGGAAVRGVGNIAAKTGTQLWTSTSKVSSVKNAFGHWKKHGAEFPEFINAKQYVEGAKSFMHNSPAGTLIKTRA